MNCFLLFETHALNSIILRFPEIRDRIRAAKFETKKETLLSNFTVVVPVWVNKGRKRPWKMQKTGTICKTKCQDSF